MLWYLGQSWLVILASLLLGLLIGWMVWRLPWRRKYVTESQVITKLTQEQHARTAAKDAEISRLNAELAEARSLGARPLLGTSSAALRSSSTAPRATSPASSPLNTAATAPATESESRLSATSGGVSSVDVTKTEIDKIDISETRVNLPSVTRPSATVATPEDADATATTGEMSPIRLGHFDAAEKSPITEQYRSQATFASAAAASTTSEPTLTPAPIKTTAESSAAPVETSALGKSPIDTSASTETDEDSAAPHHPPALPAKGVSAEPFTTSPFVTPRSSEQKPGAANTDETDSDDLERVEGIGPRIAAALRGAGIHTYAELADSDVARLQGALEAAGLRFAPSLPTWSRQARLLADGDEDGFMQLTDHLVGGRDIRRRS